MLDGESIRGFSTAELREKIGLVLQDPFLFYGTVKDNIRLHNTELTDEWIEEAAGFIQASSFIEKLEGGFEHKVVEKGQAFLSGGTAIARFCENGRNESKNSCPR